MWKQSDAPLAQDKAATYERLAAQLKGLLDGSRDRVANAANTCALLYQSLPRLNWAGFYFLDATGRELVLGPFQGKPACVRISLDQGVCGHAATTRRSVVVANVQEFEGHIACDEASLSELVAPIMQEEALIGVLDLDSPDLGRFDAEDRVGCERIASIYAESLRAHP
ncbi:MAG: GAF domain-containing protein [Steroidobacteraceae bacterium]